MPWIGAALICLVQAAPSPSPSPSPSPTPEPAPLTPRRLRLDVERHVESVMQSRDDGTPRFQESVDTLKASIGLGADVIDPNASEADRRRAAALRVDQFFDRMTQGQARMQVLPGMLTWTLRRDAKAHINPAGLQQAVALAQAQLGADSTGATGAAPPGPIRQAPGGPPVTGGDAP